MNELTKYFKKPIICDTGPLLFLLEGSIEPRWVSNRGFLKELTIEEYNLLISFIGQFTKIIVTREVLTECSNSLKRKWKKESYHVLSNIIAFFERLEEQYTAKNVIIGNPGFPRVGFTDTGLVECSRENGYLVFTKDVGVEDMCNENQLPVVHFDKLRFITWGNE